MIASKTDSWRILTTFNLYLLKCHIIAHLLCGTVFQVTIIRYEAGYNALRIWNVDVSKHILMGYEMEICCLVKMRYESAINEIENWY